MPVAVLVQNQDKNHVEIDPYFLSEGDGYVNVLGENCRLIIKRPHAPGAVEIVVQDGGSIEIEPECILGGLRAHALTAGATIHVGQRTAFNGVVHVTAHEPASVTIGAECLFGADCSVSSSDVHKIIRVKDSKRLNPAGNITIGDRVWFGARAAIFRDSSIGHDSVVGWSSVVKGHHRSNVVIAGAPARVVRRGIRWER